MSQPILTLNQIGHRFGATVVLSDINLAVATGETLAIIGPNGAGKSTLFNLISGAMRPHTGTISLNGQAIQGLPVQQVTRRGIGRSFQISQLFDSLTVEESIIAASFWQSGMGHQFWRPLRGAVAEKAGLMARAEALMAALGLTHKRQMLAGALPYADQRALDIAQAVASGASVLLLDEPTAGMSKAQTAQFLSRIAEITKDKTILLIEHDMSVVFELADRIAVLVGGELLACDVPQAVRRNPAVQAAYLGEWRQEGESWPS